MCTQEIQRLMQDPAPGIQAHPSNDNLRYFNVAIEGPADSPYEGGTFKLELFLPEDYPMAAPKVGGGWGARILDVKGVDMQYVYLTQVRFITKVYHPNVDKLGRICLDILKDKWSPALQIRTVLIRWVVDDEFPLADVCLQSWLARRCFCQNNHIACTPLQYSSTAECPQSRGPTG